LKKSYLLEEVGELEKEFDRLKDRLDDMDSEVDDDIGRMSYVRQLTAEFLDVISTMVTELEPQVEIPETIEKVNKMLGRSERKRYYMSKFRL
jgi:predicted nuclease with TOPRIM domain